MYLLFIRKIFEKEKIFSKVFTFYGTLKCGNYLFEKENRSTTDIPNLTEN